MPLEAGLGLNDSGLSQRGDAVDGVGRSGVGAPVVFSVTAGKPDVTIGNGSIPSSSQVRWPKKTKAKDKTLATVAAK